MDDGLRKSLYSTKIRYMTTYKYNLSQEAVLPLFCRSEGLY